MLAITTDYVQSQGDPQPYLRRIAEAGFSHVHWCHHWNTDFVYSTPEIQQIQRWFKEYHLQLLNLHASHGREKYWVSPVDYQRQAGVGLVRNRLEMTARLGGDVLIVHVPSTAPVEEHPTWLDCIRRSLDQLEPYARRSGISLAVENMPGDDYQMLGILLGEYDPAYLGFCYDAGHANLAGGDLAQLSAWSQRLTALHLHDNDGSADQHRLPFTATVNWAELARRIAASSYAKCLNFEVCIQESGYTDEAEFLQQARQAGEKLTAMVDSYRQLP